ncbi:hypothetical protein [Flavobacterium sp.]|uniref:hypothetical protein n=1 Tax=Flavobacterium sp. TaxID=239 RepID=UPI001225A2E5|nr:hypothetical protein [Flavobacterium sp.]RZJ72440.1 MAG: hypothetical protein EOO49_05875 [Flavobacterium sp.]
MDKFAHIIQQAHSGWAYITLLVLVIAVINGIAGFTSAREFKASDRRLGLFALIASHIQLVIGLITYFTSPLGLSAFGQMKNAALRLTSLEHPLVNIIAIVLITIGWSKHKRKELSKDKFKCFAIFYTLGLVFLLSRIPWKLWF